MAVTIADKVRDQLQLHMDLPSPAERRRLREAGGLSQQELGSIVGVTRQAVAQWESGARRNPRGPLLARYVEALRALLGIRLMSHAALKIAEAEAVGDIARANYWRKVKAIVDQAPPLDEATKSRLRVLLRPAAAESPPKSARPAA